MGRTETTCSFAPGCSYRVCAAARVALSLARPNCGDETVCPSPPVGTPPTQAVLGAFWPATGAPASLSLSPPTAARGQMRLGKPTTVYAWVDERVDHQIGDASALGRARIDAASASRARKAEISKRLAAENAEARRRNQGTALRTDADITDEAAGARRVELAAESKARKEAAAKYLAQKNRELARARASKGAATDFDITDDAAGFARVQMAEASEARRREKARRLAAANAEQRRRNTQTALRTDADITDEEAGARRRRGVLPHEYLVADCRERLDLDSALLGERFQFTPTLPLLFAEHVLL